jgi:sialic acid synthase SpsE
LKLKGLEAQLAYLTEIISTLNINQTEETTSVSVEIVAELAQGFEGCEIQAKMLIKAAKFSGADAAKLQMVFADELATPDYEYYRLFLSLELKDAVWLEIVKYAEDLGIKIYFDIFGYRSLKLAEKIGASAVKLHGTDISNEALLKRVAKSKLSKILLGAGGAYLSEIEKAISILKHKEVVVLLGFQGYPTAIEANQVGRVSLLSKSLNTWGMNVKLGFADHTDSVEPISSAVSAMALGAGASVIEKHLTLGKNMQLEDFESALNPDEFLVFARTIRACADAYGAWCSSDDFGMSKAEIDYRLQVRRHVIAGKNLEAGMVISPDDVTLKRSSSKNAIHDLSLVYQKRVLKDVSNNAPLSPSDIREN